MLSIDQFNQADFDDYKGYDIHFYEILGYIIKPKSAEWALLQMMNGVKVIYNGSSHPHYIDNGKITFNHVDDMDEGLYEWLMLRLSTAPDGWEIYKSEPSKPEYRTGDWVEHNDSKEQAKITHIASKNLS